MRCLECQAYDLLEHRFCPCCGRLLAQVACPRCGARSGRRNPECPLCGDTGASERECTATSCVEADADRTGAPSGHDTEPAHLRDAEPQWSVPLATVDAGAGSQDAVPAEGGCTTPTPVPDSGGVAPAFATSASDGMAVAPLARRESVAASHYEAWAKSSSEEAPIPQPWWAPKQPGGDAGSSPTREPEPAHDGAAAADVGRTGAADPVPNTTQKPPRLAVVRPAVSPRAAGTWTRPAPRRPTTRASFLVVGLLVILVATAVLFQRAVGVPILGLWDLRPVASIAAPANGASPEQRAAAAQPSGPASPAIAEQARAATATSAPGTKTGAQAPGPGGSPTSRPARKPAGRTSANRSGRAASTAGTHAAVEPAALPSIRYAAALPMASAVSPPPIARPAPATTPGRQVFEQHQVDIRPAIARRVAPTYPASARARGLQELVVVRVLVTAAGEPSQVTVLRPSKVDRAFDAAAVSAVRQWTFSPARRRDRAVACWFNVGVPFRAEAPAAGGDSQ